MEKKRWGGMRVGISTYTLKENLFASCHPLNQPDLFFSRPSLLWVSSPNSHNPKSKHISQSNPRVPFSTRIDFNPNCSSPLISVDFNSYPGGIARKASAIDPGCRFGQLRI